MIYLLDGYNITKQIEILLGKELKQQRDWLIETLIKAKPQGSYKNKVIVVFDGKYELSSGEDFRKLDYYNIKVIFASFSSADDEIKKLVEKAKNKKEIIVVTDDKEIIRYVRYYGAKVESVKDFLCRIEKSKEQKNLKISQYKFDIPSESVEEINKEMKKYYDIDEKNNKSKEK
jgi:predicted RNA-binding protein with PIN domain